VADLASWRVPDMPNLYVDTAAPAAATPPLEGNARADVIVVGAGFTGLSTALHLAERGVKVLVLEADTVGWGASGRNGGQVNPGLKHDPDVVEADFGADLGSRMNALAGAAPKLVFDLLARHGISCEARQNGTLRAATHGRHAAFIRTTVEQLVRRGAPVELWEGAVLARATGTDRYVAAMFDPRGGDVHPLRYARGLAQAAVRLGATVCGHSRALKIEATGAHWRVLTRGGQAVAPQVVLATNGYTDDLWPALKRTVVPVFGAIAATAPLPAALAAQILPGRPVLYESGAITVYYRVDCADRLIIGGRGPMREIDSPAAIPHILRYARRLWPALSEVAWTHAWGGRLAMTRDAYPHLHEPARGVWVSLGYNGRGVAMATTMGKVLAGRILDPAAEIDMPITGLREIPLHGLWPLAVQAAIARGRLFDTLGL
jgi:glycine/D-amino acid oxidase-like deaminating enzyme